MSKEPIAKAAKHAFGVQGLNENSCYLEVNRSNDLKIPLEKSLNYEQGLYTGL